MSETLVINLKPSKYYLTLSSLVYLLSLFTSWYYFYHLYLSILLSITLSVLAYQFFAKIIFLAKGESVKKITLSDKQLSVEKQNKSVKKYPWFYPTYQSSFLVIITFGKESIVIFKDSVEHHSLSKLNKLINANT
ncbi:MAG: hypothetical protein HOI13_03290 [Candidatus Thioglobus sp.]|jgi:uncharacterized membrane protein|nr:hypothetical protein [Candidatus Thioglobus sp.]